MAADPLAPTSAITATSQAKKPRKNPARRKAERAHSETAAQASETQTQQATAPPKLQRARSDTPQQAGATALQRSVSSQQRPMPARSTTEPSKPTSAPNNQTSNGDKCVVALAAPAIVTGGLLGCAAGAAILAGVSVWNEYASTEAAVLAVRAAKLCIDNMAEETIVSLKAGTYSTDEAVDTLRRMTLAYGSTIPGGTAYVERIFREVNLVRKLRGAEMDQILSQSFAELRANAGKGLSAEAMRGAVIQQFAKLSSVAASSLKDVVDRNPSLKPLRDSAKKSLEGSPKLKVPTVKVNMTVRQKIKT